MDSKKELAKAVAEIDFPGVTTEALKSAGYKAFPIGELDAFGEAGDALKNFLQSPAVPGGEGLYRVKFPAGAHGPLSKFKNENAFLGSGLSKDEIFQARLTPAEYDPTQMFMAFALMDIEQKLGTIIEMQQEILQFIHATEEAKIEGGIKSLNNAVAEYKFRWDDEEFIRINLNLACDLRKQAEQSKALYLKQINCILDLSDMPHMMQSAAKKVKELAVNLHNYYSALYLGEYAAFLDTLLGNNLKEEYLAYIKGRMEEEQHEYLDLQDRCREWAKKRLESSADYVAAPVYRGLDSFYEKALEKLQIPFDFDKIYKNDKELFQPAEEQMDKLDIAKEGKVTVFPETLQEIRAMYVSLPDIYADDKTVYLRLSGADEDKQLLQA